MQTVRTVLRWFLLVAMVAWPIFILSRPATAFDVGPDLCLSKVLFDTECYGCGMTRACMRLAHGQITEAGKFNKLAYLVFPILCILYVAEALKVSNKVGLPVPEGVMKTLRKLRM